METKLTNEILFFIKTCNALAQAFENAYWSMGDISYKEELCITFIEENKIAIPIAEKMLYKIGLTKRESPFVHLWLNKHIESKMGMFTGITDYGTKKLISIRGF
jgi:hypothetical protein